MSKIRFEFPEYFTYPGLACDRRVILAALARKNISERPIRVAAVLDGAFPRAYASEADRRFDYADHTVGYISSRTTVREAEKLLARAAALVEEE